MIQTTKQFIKDSYSLISASSPTVPLQGYDTFDGLNILNRLVRSFSDSALMLTIAQEVIYDLSIGQSNITFGAASYVPTPNVTQGRLANMQNAWLLLDGVTYPLVDESRNVFFASYKYDPQVGLPRFAIITNLVDLTNMRIYPGASQPYELHVYGKFELPDFTETSSMEALPGYYQRFLQLALAKDLAMYKGRMSAWTEGLEKEYLKSEANTIAVSAVNLVIQTENESLLNGAYRVRAGV